MAIKKAVDEPVHFVVEGDARERLKVSAKDLLSLDKRSGVAWLFAPFARESGDRLGLQKLRRDA